MIFMRGLLTSIIFGSNSKNKVQAYLKALLDSLYTLY